MGGGSGRIGKAQRMKCQQQDCTSWRHPVSPTELLHSKGPAADGEVTFYHSLNHGHWKFYPFSLFLSFVFNCRKSRRAACSLAEGRKKIFLITLPWRHLFFPSLHLLLEKLRHNSTHYIHSEDEKEHSCPLLLWKSIQRFITGCNSTHLIQKHILTLPAYMKGHHGCPFNSIASHIFLSIKYLLWEEKKTILWKQLSLSTCIYHYFSAGLQEQMEKCLLCSTTWFPAGPSSASKRC